MPRILDTYCSAGGMGKGYFDAGFDVYGVDFIEQPNYPFPFAHGEAIATLRKLIDGGTVGFTNGERLSLTDFDAMHASPPCQTFSKTKSLHDNTHPDLVEPTREALQATGLPWVMENVVGAPLIAPIMLCGSEFDIFADDVDGEPLKLIRHRLFESSIELQGAGGCRHDPDVFTASVYGAGGGWTPEHRDSPTRRGGYVPATSVIRDLMGIDWMSKHEMSQSVPPVMAEHVGRQLLAHVTVAV